MENLFVKVDHFKPRFHNFCIVHWWVHHHDHHDWQSAAGFRCVAFMAAFRSRRGGTQSKASLLLGLLTIMSNVMMMMIFSAGFYIIPPSSLKMAKNFESEAWYGSKDVKTRTIKDKPFFLNRIDCFWSNLLAYLSSFPCKFSGQRDVVVEKTLLDIRGHATDH